ncbi:ionotropic receptor 21a [Eurytemora carolleeae]|uniref:ionotropic receptor 21a n=1 Tax=Eurytemora carolleeae TaxID=1294199 RepID=UPI000C77DEE2|nr:ionotropic receptor 21a [Eurytemora carolleeae]|eukprot:XP_023331754.1 ionotropic receptor 21a-like [Eurytemora affinis]
MYLLMMKPWHILEFLSAKTNIILPSESVLAVFQEDQSEVQEFFRNPVISAKTQFTVGNYEKGIIELYTNLYYTKGRKTKTIKLGSFINGKMYYNHALIKEIGLQGRIFPEKMKDFDGFRFKVAAFHYPPKVIQERSGKWGGVETEIIRQVGNSLNFSIEVEEPEDRMKWGSEYIKNGTSYFTGVMGKMVYKQNDFGFGNHFITPERLEVMDMTIPYHIDRACFAVPAAKEIPNYFTFILPYHWLVWLLILSTFLFFILPSLVIFLRFDDESPKGIYEDIYQGFWLMFFYFTTNINQLPDPVKPRRGALRLFLSVSWGFVLIITLAYSMLVTSGLSWGVRDSGGWPDWFKDSSDDLSKQVFNGFKNVKTFEEGVSKVAEGRYAFLNSEAALEYLISANYTNQFREKTIHISRQCFVPFRIGICMPLGKYHLDIL